MTGLKIIKATYYVPEIGIDKGTDVTIELSAQIIDDRLFYYGIYNLIFPDHFKGKLKRLRLEIEYGNNRSIKDYGENEKINLPHDLGENLKNKTSAKDASRNVFGDYVAGDKIGRDKNVNTLKLSWLKKYWWGFLIPMIVGVLIYTINEGKLPGLFNKINSPTADKDTAAYKDTIMAAGTPNLANIFRKNNSLSTSLEKQNFIENYKDLIVDGSGSFIDISKRGLGYIVDMTIENNIIGCQFDENFEKTLLLLKKGDIVNFSGKFTGGGLAFGSNGVNPWYIIDCVLR